MVHGMKKYVNRNCLFIISALKMLFGYFQWSDHIEGKTIGRTIGKMAFCELEETNLFDS